jgi:hypothetical protein
MASNGLENYSNFFCDFNSGQYHVFDFSHGSTEISVVYIHETPCFRGNKKSS